VIREAESAPQLSRRLAGVLETLWLRRAASGTGGGGAVADGTPSEALAPARGTALGAILGGACWLVLAALAWALAG
jgi:hypothetical protein